MQIFRCYALNERGSIVAAENFEGLELSAIIEAGWSFVASRPASAAGAGLEVWQGRQRLFSTSPMG
jgi:hypothetical protein